MATQKKKHAPLFSRAGTALLQDVLRSAGARPIGKSTPVIKGQYTIEFADAAATGIAQDLSPASPASTHRPSVRRGLSAAASNSISTSRRPSWDWRSASRSNRSTSANPEGATPTTKARGRGVAGRGDRLSPSPALSGHVAVLFLPFDSCEPSKPGSTISTFASWVRHMRPRRGPSAADGRSRSPRAHLHRALRAGRIRFAVLRRAHRAAEARPAVQDRASKGHFPIGSRGDSEKHPELPRVSRGRASAAPPTQRSGLRLGGRRGGSSGRLAVNARPHHVRGDTARIRSTSAVSAASRVLPLVSHSQTVNTRHPAASRPEHRRRSSPSDSERPRSLSAVRPSW